MIGRFRPLGQATTAPAAAPPTAPPSGGGKAPLAAAALVVIGLAGLLYASSTHDRHWREERGLGPNY